MFTFSREPNAAVFNKCCRTVVAFLIHSVFFILVGCVESVDILECLRPIFNTLADLYKLKLIFLREIIDLDTQLGCLLLDHFSSLLAIYFFYSFSCAYLVNPIRTSGVILTSHGSFLLVFKYLELEYNIEIFSIPQKFILTNDNTRIIAKILK